jgi:hypothetical protein
MSPLTEAFYVMFSVDALRQLALLPDGERETVWNRSRELGKLASAAPVSGPPHERRQILCLEFDGRQLFFEVERIARVLVIERFGFGPGAALAGASDDRQAS